MKLEVKCYLVAKNEVHIPNYKLGLIQLTAHSKEKNVPLQSTDGNSSIARSYNHEENFLFLPHHEDYS